MKIAHATTHDSQIICTRPCGAFGVAHAHLLDARDEAVLMSRMSTQDSPALSNKESLEEAPHPRLPANAELVELGPRLERQSAGLRLVDHDALLGRRHLVGLAQHGEQEWMRSCSGSQQPHLEDTLLNRSCELHNIPHTIVTSVRVRFGRYPCASERCKE